MEITPQTSLDQDTTLRTKLKDRDFVFHCIADESQGDGAQQTLFAAHAIENPPQRISSQKTTPQKTSKYCPHPEQQNGYFHLKNRRYLGNKHKLLGFLEYIISEKCGAIKSLCDIFAGTGVVGERFNTPDIQIISNDFLSANYICLQTFLGSERNLHKILVGKIEYLNNLERNNLERTRDEYFFKNFGGTYFSEENARKIGIVREEIENIAESENERNALICSLLYAMDKIANTVGHYDAYRKKLDTFRPIKLLIPQVNYYNNKNNAIYREDANKLIKNISCNVLYVDPPYNSRQYSDTYHLLENVAEWNRPEVVGTGKKMDRAHIKSDYCLKTAAHAFSELIRHADCEHILLSYNNTGNSKDGRSNARMSDEEILQILNEKGNVDIFETNYKAFTTGKSHDEHNAERVFYCKVKN